ncbi:MAG: efflux RND transporter periplasmic adaptor subunit [Burkholderiaceae bacterium]
MKDVDAMFSNHRHKIFAAAGVTAALLVLAAAALAARAANDKPQAGAAAASAARPSLTVTVTTPQATRWPQTLAANGNITAWQEAIIGAEAQGLRLTEVRAQVGDRVKRGQVLALLASETLAADAAATRASLAEAEANQAEAAANADRARQLQASGAISAQQIQQYVTGEATARARAAAVRARVRADQVRLAQTRILAPDDGIVSARSATVGAVVQPGQELFRLIRKERLEWRAEVAAAELTRLQPGMPAKLTLAGGQTVQGTLRTVAPTVDAATRNGVVFVDLPQPGAAKAGMFARGEFAVGELPALTLPQSAVLLRDGFSYVFQVGPDAKVREVKVAVGQRNGDRIAVTGGLDAKANVVAQGAGFLADGDTVRVVASTTAKL